MITLKQFLLLTPFNKVWDKIVLHYSDSKVREIKSIQEDFRVLYEKLLNIDLKENETNMFIYINVFKNEENDEPVQQLSFDENNNNLYFDVSGRDDDHTGYSLVGCSFNEWLDFYIDKEMMKSMSTESIIAHCLWEMTLFGYDNFD
jgi:hypothetical protein